MKVLVNGQPSDFPEGSTVAEIVRRHGDGNGGRGLAVALNGAVVRRADWSQVRLNEADKVEVLRAIGGGAA